MPPHRPRWGVPVAPRHREVRGIAQLFSRRFSSQSHRHAFPPAKAVVFFPFLCSPCCTLSIWHARILYTAFLAGAYFIFPYISEQHRFCHPASVTRLRIPRTLQNTISYSEATDPLSTPRRINSLPRFSRCRAVAPSLFPEGGTSARNDGHLRPAIEAQGRTDGDQGPSPGSAAPAAQTQAAAARRPDPERQARRVYRQQSVRKWDPASLAEAPVLVLGALRQRLACLVVRRREVRRAQAQSSGREQSLPRQPQICRRLRSRRRRGKLGGYVGRAEEAEADTCQYKPHPAAPTDVGRRRCARQGDPYHTRFGAGIAG